MTSARRGDIVLVSFPYVERDRARRRPALVISEGVVGPERLLWVLMITGASNPSWSSDVQIGPDFADMGLRAPSVVRCGKVATIEATTAETVGVLPANQLATVDAVVKEILGFAPGRHTANP
ncbi:MAG: type II toxin-antitoxin system PemK/MazF family toxin [Caulobacteraceae bacterium]|nr:type II toxin-antitoxin system PemK/MazF family toxin [Caulobacteraceae bacterium]